MSSRSGPWTAPDKCEICAAGLTTWELRRGGRVSRCLSCGHVLRSLEECPANHRSAAYGGDPALDRGRLALTYRALTASGLPRSVFEIGYGSGALLRRFAEAGVEIGGVDPGQLDVGVDAALRDQASLWQGTIEDVPDGAYRADLVFGVHVIEHVADPLRAMRKATTLLVDGGRLVLLTPAADSWGLTAYGSAWWMLEDPTHIRFFTEASLEEAARRVGFQNVRVDRLVLDSLTVDAASVARMVRRPGPAGALASKSVLAAGLLTAPAVAAMRLISPRTRPTLRLTAEWLAP